MYEDIPRGQLSSIILDCLKDQDKYGYEIIDEVLQRSNGKITIKQPSLYSNLKRMEDQSLISSYWRESDIGGKRHYYHLTDLGKKYLEKWQVDKSIYDTQKDDKPVFVLQQENLFNLGKKDEPQKENLKQEDKVEQKQNDSFVQYDLFSNNNIVTAPSMSEEVDEEKFEHKSDNQIQEQSPILTNYEKQDDINETKFDYVGKTNKSFSEVCYNAVEVENRKYTLKYDQEDIANQTDNVQSSISTEKSDDSETANNVYLESKEESFGSNQESAQNIEKYEDETQNTIASNQSLQSKDDKVDDGVFITERIEAPILNSSWQKKSYHIFNEQNKERFIKENSETDIKIYELYEKSKNKSDESLIKNNIGYYTYDDLKALYSSQNIRFSAYNKVLKKAKGKTDIVKVTKLHFFNNLCLLGLYSLISLIFGIIIALCDKSAYLFSPFTFIIYPIILGIFTLVSFIEYKRFPKKMAERNSLANYSNFVFCLTMTIIPIIFALNLLCGFNFANFNLYAVSILYPIFMSFTYGLFFLIRKFLLKSKSMY